MRWSKNSRSTRPGATENSADTAGRPATRSNDLALARGTDRGCACFAISTSPARLQLNARIDPRQLVLVVVKVDEPRAGDGCKLAHRFEVGGALKLDRADEATNGARLEPFPHQRQQPLGVAHDVGKQPIDRSHGPRVE